MYIGVPSTVGNFFKNFVTRVLLHVAGYFDIFFHLQQDASLWKECQWEQKWTSLEDVTISLTWNNFSGPLWRSTNQFAINVQIFEDPRFKVFWDTAVMSQTGISEEHFLQPHHFMAVWRDQNDTVCILEFTFTYPLHEITGNIALRYNSLIDITSKSNSLTLFIVLKSICYIRKVNNEIHIFLASGGLHRVI
jgi:hypothetical protein